MFESADGEPLPIRNRVAAEVDFRGIETVLSYDQRGNLTGHSRGGVTVEYAVLPNGDRHLTTDGNGDTLTHDYDAYGQEIAQTDVIGQRWRKHFDARGRLLWSEDGHSRRTEFEYDLLDRPTRVRHPAIDDALSDAGRAEDITEYLDAERRIRITDGRGVISTRLHDAMGRVIEEVEAVGLPEQRRRSMRHDANGNTVESRSWRGNLTTSLYDAANRLVQRDEPLGRRTSYTYDPLGNVLSETIADSTAGASAIPRQTEYGYADPFYRRTSTRRIGEDLVLETTASWDANGNLVAETDANGKLTSHSYDQRDRLHVSTYPHGRVITRGYDGADRKLSETLSDANADEDRFVPQQRTWRYDQRGRRTAAIDAEQGTTLTGYDGADNPVLVTDPTGGQWTKVYDARNRLTEERGPIDGQVTDYGLDHQGNRIATFSPDGRELIQTYDGLGRLQQTSDQLGRIERCLVLTIDESREQTAAIQARQRQARTLDGLLMKARTDDVLAAHRAAQRFVYELAFDGDATSDALHAPGLVALDDSPTTANLVGVNGDLVARSWPASGDLVATSWGQETAANPHVAAGFSALAAAVGETAHPEPMPLRRRNGSAVHAVQSAG